jgi:hypothetical protein
LNPGHKEQNTNSWSLLISGVAAGWSGWAMVYPMGRPTEPPAHQIQQKNTAYVQSNSSSDAGLNLKQQITVEPIEKTTAASYGYMSTSYYYRLY